MRWCLRGIRSRHQVDSGIAAYPLLPARPPSLERTTPPFKEAFSSVPASLAYEASTVNTTAMPVFASLQENCPVRLEVPMT